MNPLTEARSSRKPHPGLTGPGRLVLVVGPSGAGKDTLISGARAACTDDRSLVFPRRVVTRPASEAEDHATVDAVSFERAVIEGAFALWWQAHGNSYGIPSSINADIRAGRTVVCNVSRTIVDLARQRYSFVTVVLITAPSDVLYSRLSRRRRSGDGEIAERVERSVKIEKLFTADVVISNIGRPEIGIHRLIRVIRNDARAARGKTVRHSR